MSLNYGANILPEVIVTAISILVIIAAIEGLCEKKPSNQAQLRARKLGKQDDDSTNRMLRMAHASKLEILSARPP